MELTWLELNSVKNELFEIDANTGTNWKTDKTTYKPLKL